MAIYIWRYRNEGVEAFNKTLSKRCNMFNSAGNKGLLASNGEVKPFEVLGKWMGRYVMWQLEFANNLFIGKGGMLGTTEICWDSSTASFMTDDDVAIDENQADNDDYEYVYDTSDTDSDIDATLTPEDLGLCLPLCDEITRYSFRKRPHDVD
jgi:hypothetical protein